MNKFLRNNKWLIILALAALVTFCINQFPLFIEQYYSTGFYPYLSKSERILFGWLPFSLGDIMYGVVIIWLLIGLIKFIGRWRRRELKKTALFNYFKRLLRICLIVYVSFNWLWGFNYNRLGSAYQMQLTFSKYSNAELTQLVDTLQNRMLPYFNDSTSFLPFKKQQTLSNECVKCYNRAATQYPFLQYQGKSIKPQIMYSFGNYIGFLGYLNPFTAEAQLNTSIPLILKPAVLCHEMGHQLGYASESTNPAFKYSIYFDMYGYAINDLYYRDSILARKKVELLPEKIRYDRRVVRQFFRSYKNPLSPIINWIYDKYLKMNSQPKGTDSYNEVVGWMIAYAKRYGWQKM
jgi:uncharacterized membrane protein